VILVSHGRGWAGGGGRIISLEQGKLMPSASAAWLSRTAAMFP